MVVVAYKNGEFFRGQSVTEDEIEIAKQTMLADANEELTFTIMDDDAFMSQ